MYSHDHELHRPEAARRFERLNRVLQAVRRIGRLIARERDPDRLVAGACEALVEARGFPAAAFVAPGPCGPRLVAAAGDARYRRGIRHAVEREVAPSCFSAAVADGRTLVRRRPDPACEGCPACGVCQREAHLLAVPVRVEGGVLGVLHVWLPPAQPADAEERLLLEETAEDLAFALQAARTEADRAAAREALRESERALRTLLGNLPGMAYRCRADANWTMEFVSAGCHDILGVSAEALTAGTVTYEQLIHPEDRSGVREEVRQAVSDGRPFVLEYRVCRPDGEVRWIWEKGVQVPSGEGTPRLEGFVLDVTGRREAEEGARAVYQSLPIPTFVWRRTGTGFVLADCNEASAALWSRDSGRALGSSLETLGPDVAWMGPQLERCYRRRAPLKDEIELPDEAGGRRRLALTYGFVPPDRVVVHVQDETEQRSFEEQLRVSQRMEAVGRLAGGVAHDFNNLLSVINTCAAFALEETREGDRLREDLQEIRDAGARAAGLTRQLLAFSRKQVLSTEPLDLNDVLASIHRMLARIIGEDVELVTSPAAELGLIEADRGQLEQVVVNLAVNARDAMPTGGRLSLETRNVELGEQAASAARVAPGAYVLLAVSDTGCGMDAPTVERIFEPFFTTKEVGKGTGLGLSTVHGIVTQSGGGVVVRSAPGRGTTFEVYLSRMEGGAGPARGAIRCAPKARRGTETILVVEDEAAVRTVAERVLTRAGYRVLTAADGAEALETLAARRGTVDLVLTDLVMPGMSGRELAERLAVTAPEVEVLYMSGYAGDTLTDQALLEPETPFVSKPFAAEELTRKVRELLDRPPAAG